MIILIILLGLGFLGGGVAAIIDGMPYLVLERGFTQVIIGTVVAVAGVILLALAVLLSKLRALENRLAGATMALSLVGAAGTAAREPTLPVPAPAAEPASALGPSAAAAAVAGALAGAGLAGTGAASPVEPEPADKTDEPDLFGAHLATVLETEAGTPAEAALDSAEPAAAEAGTQPIATETDPVPADVELLPVFDPFRPVDPEPAPPVDPAEPGELALPPPAGDDLPPLSAELHDPADPWTDAPAPVPERAEPAAPPAADIDDPLTPAAPPAATEDDEFGRLRESLAGLGLGPVGGRVEPRFDEPRPPVEPDDIAAAASWMDSALSRRAAEPEATGEIEVMPPSRRLEPTLSADLSWPVLDREDRTVPSWPPQTREAPAAEPVAEVDAPSPEVQPREPDDEPAAAPVEEAPAASEEGIVGAYQVGEAHFTIYADGSIKARTPEGDYSFASMDELKVYLASERSRLEG